MDEEELEQPRKKITLSNFFESIVSVEKVANRAFEKTNANLDAINDNKSLIQALTQSLDDALIEIREIKEYITIEKDEEKDRLFSEEDQEQKERRFKRVRSILDTDDTEEDISDDETGENIVSRALQNPNIIQMIGGFVALFVARYLNPSNFIETINPISRVKGIFGRGMTGEVDEETKEQNIQKFYDGGKVLDTDNDTSNNDVDSVPAVLTPGEFVVTKDAVEKVGVDTLEGLNASVGATNEPTYTMGYRRGQITPEQLIVSSTRFKEKTTQKRMGGQGGRALGSTTKRQGGDTFESKNIFGENYAGVSQRTTSTSLDYIPGSDGVRDSNLKTKKIMEEDIVSVAVEDIIEHQDDLLKRIRRVKGYENVTIEDVINDRVDMPDQQYVRLLGHSDAAKATDKKQTEAIKLDKEKHGDGYYNYFDKGFNQGGLVEGVKNMYNKDDEVDKFSFEMMKKFEGHSGTAYPDVIDDDGDGYYNYFDKGFNQGGLVEGVKNMYNKDDEVDKFSFEMMKKFEGHSGTAYPDVVDDDGNVLQYAIGYGSSFLPPFITGEEKTRPVRKGDKITKKQATQLKEFDIDRIQDKVNSELSDVGLKLDDLPVRVSSVLTSLGFNYGSLEGVHPLKDRKFNEGKLDTDKSKYTESVVEMIKSGYDKKDFTNFANFLEFNKSQDKPGTGLEARRKDEALIIKTGSGSDYYGLQNLNIPKPNDKSSDNLQSVVESKTDKLSQSIFTPPTSTQNSNVTLLPVPMGNNQPQPINANDSVVAPAQPSNVDTTTVASTMSSVSFINMISNKQLSIG